MGSLLLTPQTASSCAEPDKLLSLPRLLVSDELFDVPGICEKMKLVNQLLPRASGDERVCGASSSVS